MNRYCHYIMSFYYLLFIIRLVSICWWHNDLLRRLRGWCIYRVLMLMSVLMDMRLSVLVNMVRSRVLMHMLFLSGAVEAGRLPLGHVLMNMRDWVLSVLMHMRSEYSIDNFLLSRCILSNLRDILMDQLRTIDDLSVALLAGSLVRRRHRFWLFHLLLDYYNNGW